jgi:hypothetical protein
MVLFAFKFLLNLCLLHVFVRSFATKVVDFNFFYYLQSPEKANDDGLIFPWKHREIVTFDIPVHDTEKAGLGHTKH